mmetsp:Transcript_12169/g.21706  ORF Transcript_12169/g.21706 Transcript_12169/m.21706 type:complete len:238 (-) Transcript_12169:1013-1726(-)
MLLHSSTKSRFAGFSRYRGIAKRLSKSCGFRRSRPDCLGSSMFESSSARTFISRGCISLETQVCELETHLHKAISSNLTLDQVCLAPVYALKGSDFEGSNRTVDGFGSCLNRSLVVTAQLEFKTPWHTHFTRACSGRNRWDVRRSLVTRRGCNRVIVNFVKVAKYSNTITPSMLKVHTCFSVCGYNELKALIKPAVSSVSVKHGGGNLLVRLGTFVVKANGEQSRVNRLQCRLVCRA